MATQEITIDAEYMLKELEKSYEHWNAAARWGNGEMEHSAQYCEGRVDQLRFIIDYIRRNGYAKI